MRRAAMALGFVLAAIMAVLVACSSGNEHDCFGGCLCYSADSCPTGCYRSQTNGTAPVCSNGIVDCVQGGGTWSVGTPMNNCGGGTPRFVTGEGAPSGAFCCAPQPNVSVDSGDDSVGNGEGSTVDATDGAADSSNSDAAPGATDAGLLPALGVVLSGGCSPVDCPLPALCGGTLLGPTTGVTFCTLACSQNADCPSGDVCAAADVGHCLKSCASDSDCSGGFKCVSGGYCFSPFALGDAAGE